MTNTARVDDVVDFAEDRYYLDQLPDSLRLFLMYDAESNFSAREVYEHWMRGASTREMLDHMRSFNISLMLSSYGEYPGTIRATQRTRPITPSQLTRPRRRGRVRRLL